MAVLSKEDFAKLLKEKFGNDTSDEGIKALEDLTDTYNDLENKSKEGNSDDWKTKYDELDKTWRKRYTDRFFGKADDEQNRVDPPELDDGESENAIKIDDLFKEE